MKLLRPLFCWVALLVALVVVLPFQSQFRRDAGAFALEVQAAADHPGHIQLYFDRGHGIIEADSSTLALQGSPEPVAYRLELPEGVITHLRLDPTDRDGTVTLKSLRVVNRHGDTLRELPLSGVQAGGQIQELRLNRARADAAGAQANAPGGRVPPSLPSSLRPSLTVVVTPGGNDPNLNLALDAPLDLRVALSAILLPYLVAGGLTWLAILIIAAVLERVPAVGAALTQLWRRGHERPCAAIVAAAALAVVLSAYPVIFFGKSFVSPNVGTQLLYDQFPTLPGYSDSAPVNAQGSDVGAIMWQQVPYSAVQHRSIFWNGEWPLWNRANAGGTPLLGQGQSMLGDPLHLLVVAAGGAAWAWDIKYVLAKWLLAVGLGWSVWSITRHRGAAMLTALAAPFCGFFLYRINHPAFFSFCYAPWILWGWLQLTQAGRTRKVAGALGWLIAANWMVLNSGTVKEAFALLFLLNGCGALTLLCADLPGTARLGRGAAAVAAGLLFAGLSSPFWFTFWDTLRSASSDSDSPLAWQIQPSLLLGFFDEAFYRPLTPGNRVFDPGANFLIGAGVLYFLATLRESARPRLLWGVLAAAGVSAALVFGAISPSVIRLVPFLANIHHIDNSISCGLILLSAVIAGSGFATAERRLRTPAGTGDLAIAGLLLATVIGAYLGFTDSAHRSFFGTIFPTMTVWGPGQSLPLAPFFPGYLLSLVTALGLGAWLVRRALQRGSWAPASALGLAACTGALLWRGGQLAGGAAWPDLSYQPGPRVDFSARSTAEKTIEKSARAEPSRSVGLQENFFPGWTAYYYAAETASGPDGVSNRYYREVSDATGLPRIWDWRIRLTRDNLAAARPMLDLLNVRHYVDLHSDQAALSAVLKLDQLSDLDLYESPSVWPRAFFTDRVESYRQPADFAALLSRSRGGPFAAVQLGEPGEGLVSALLSSGPTRWGQRVPPRTTPATDYHLTENATAFTVDGARNGVAVLTETYWDGYPHATVDGRTAPVLRINHAFIGVPVSAGSHRVEVRYRPRYFDVTLLIAGISALLLALCGFGACRADPLSE